MGWLSGVVGGQKMWVEIWNGMEWEDGIDCYTTYGRLASFPEESLDGGRQT